MNEIGSGLLGEVQEKLDEESPPKVIIEEFEEPSQAEITKLSQDQNLGISVVYDNIEDNLVVFKSDHAKNGGLKILSKTPLQNLSINKPYSMSEFQSQNRKVKEALGN